MPNIEALVKSRMRRFTYWRRDSSRYIERRARGIREVALTW